jgi:O-antigen/teichoic acid export membrane protein
MDESLNTSNATQDAPSPPSDQHVAKKQFAKGSAWALVQYGCTQLIRLGSNLILWRLLVPDMFGLMSIVNAFVVGLALFSDIGIGQNVIRHERGDDPVFLNTIWTLQVIRGLALSVIASLGAIPMARFYHQPMLAYLIPTVAGGLGLAAFNSTNLFTANRKMNIGRITIIEVSSQLTSLVIMIGWAYFWPSVWALAVGTTVGTGMKAVMTHVALPGIRNRFRWERETLREVAHFGRWVLVSTLLMSAASYSDRLVFGKLIPIALLGVYSIAATWAMIPTFVGGHVIQTVLFPLFSQVKGSALAERFRWLRGIVLIASAWLTSCLIAGGPALLRFLYDKRALEAGVIVQLLAIGTWFATLESANSAAILSLGRPKALAMGNGAKLIAMIILMPIGAKLFGFKMTVLAFSLSDIARYAVSAWACSKVGLNPIRQDVVLTAGIGLASAVGIAVSRGYARLGLPIASMRATAFLEGAAIFLVLTLLWAAVYRLLRRRAGATVQPAAAAPAAVP